MVLCSLGTELIFWDRVGFLGTELIFWGQSWFLSLGFLDCFVDVLGTPWGQSWFFIT